MDGTKTTTNWIIAGLVALVVIIGGGWLIARERSGTMAGTEASSTTSTTSETATAGNTNPTSPPTSAGKPVLSNPTTTALGETVTASDQPAGSSVTISDVTISSKPTWVAVRDARPWYLGAKLLSGSQKNVTIPLLRNTASGQSYEVVLFVDDGDGKFSIHGGDSLVTGTNGAPVSSTFKAQ
jgi:hypothetical protein